MDKYIRIKEGFNEALESETMFHLLWVKIENAVRLDATNFQGVHLEPKHAFELIVRMAEIIDELKSKTKESEYFQEQLENIHSFLKIEYSDFMEEIETLGDSKAETIINIIKTHILKEI